MANPADVVLFHHIRGLTDGVRELADSLRAGGHCVHAPDLFEGRLPVSIEDGLALVQGIGEEVLAERVDRAGGGRCAAARGVPAGERRVGDRAVAGRRTGAGPRHGAGPVLRP